jgi:regulatory protein
MAPPNRPDGQQGTADRADRLAELAARLAAIESRHQSSDFPEVKASGERESVGAVSGWPSLTPVTDEGRSTSPPTAGGPARRGEPEPGGHPEDDPGDPETVAKAICLRLLTVSAKPRAALAVALRQRGIPDDVAEAVLTRFVDVGLIDDEAFAQAFVAAKHRDRALGTAALRTELRRKGVDEVIVETAVRSIDEDGERDRARALISRRVDAAMGNGVVAARRRLVGLLARRGYSAELSRAVVDEALTEYGAENEREDGWFGG